MSDRDMSEQDTQHSLGKLIGENAKRDAIHIAVAPVVATERLSPGQRIGLVGHDNTQAKASATGQGIVDPFLPAPVFPGDRFWMWLVPNTITSLRHQWTHPDWESAATTSKAVSEAWLRDFCKTADCPDYDTVIAAASGKSIPAIEDYGPVAYENDGEYLFFRGRDAHAGIPPEFWTHVEIVTGVKIPDGKRATSFACSC